MQATCLRIAGGACSRVTVMRRAQRYMAQQTNGLHTRQTLPYDIEAGVAEFLPPAALKTVAIDYQQGLLNRLNDEVRGTDLENKTIAQTVIETSAHPDQVLAFNYASEALNNSFFLKSLIPPASGTSNEHGISPSLYAGINRSFMSLEQLKSNFSATALGMFNPGWVWLVCDAVGSLAVLPTFGTGTLLVRSRQVLEASHTRTRPAVQPTPSNSLDSRFPTPPLSATGLSQGTHPLHPSGSSRSFSTSPTSMRQILDGSPSSIYGSGKEPKQRIGEMIYPLMCVSVHEHAWLSAGYGVWGKEEYLKRLWPVVNWQSVSQAYELFAPKANSTSY